MSRKDYESIKKRFSDYVSTWNTHDYKEIINDVVDPYVFFSTSTSKTMANGAQDSIYGVYDFLNDFPRVDVLNARIYNYVCRMHGNQALTYAEVVCNAFCVSEKIDYLEFTVFVSAGWTKKNEKWVITSLRKEAVSEKGNLVEFFENNWHFENSVGGRLPIVRGEADSIWLNMPVYDDVLTEAEKVKECIIKNRFGEEHNNFTHCFETMSRDYGIYTYFGSDGSTMKELITEKKAARQNIRNYLSPIKFKKIEFEGDRAYIDVELVRGIHQDTGSHASADGNINVAERLEAAKKAMKDYEYTKDNLHLEHTVAKGVYEVVKENGEWKITYDKLFFGTFVNEISSDSLYGDLC